MLKQYKLRNYHFQLILYISILTIIGILLIGSAEPSVQKKQIIGFVIGIVMMIVISLMDYSFLLKFHWLYYVGICVLLIMVIFVGDDAGGAQRWIEFGDFRFQPSELAKLVLILFFSVFVYMLKFFKKSFFPKWFNFTILFLFNTRFNHIVPFCLQI